MLVEHEGERAEERDISAVLTVSGDYVTCSTRQFPSAPVKGRFGKADVARRTAALLDWRARKPEVVTDSLLCTSDDQLVMILENASGPLLAACFIRHHHVLVFLCVLP